MSSEDKEVVAAYCANCGKAEIDDVKLKDCEKCDRAKYCGDECQQDHLEKHEVICKARAAELRDDILFRQPESNHYGDCPICFLPLPIDVNKSVYFPCCCKMICNGCGYSSQMSEIGQRGKRKCIFCRKPLLLINPEKEGRKQLRKRAEANDPHALQQMGFMNNQKGDYEESFKFNSKAAELGNAVAHFNLSVAYREGEGVEKNKEMEIFHMEEAAIAGHPFARYNLACYEGRNKRYDRAVKHWIIAANLGHDESLQALKACYKNELVSKDDLAAALRAHQSAVDATKSPQREAAQRYIALNSKVCR